MQSRVHAFSARTSIKRFSTNPQQIQLHPLQAKASVAIVGSGAVGGYYGARLWECGAYDVKFHMRGENFSKSKINGLKVESIHGDIFINPDELQAFEDTKDIGQVDWVIVALKSSALDAVPALIRPLLKPAKTRVLAIMNGLIEEDLIRMLKEYMGEDDNDEHLHCCKSLYGGMAFICSNRLGPGHINHSYVGKLSVGVAAHAPTTTADESLSAFTDFWRPVKKVEMATEASILSGRWRKCLWNLPFNGISVAMGGITVDKIVTNPELRKLADLVMDETIAIANADLKEHGLDESFYLVDEEKIAMFTATDKMGPYRTSTMIDLVQRNPMEVQHIFQKPVEKANGLGIPVPHLETLVAQIRAFQSFYKLF